MKQDLYIFDYNAEKNRKIDFFYSDLLCEILFLQFKYGFKNLDKKWKFDISIFFILQNQNEKNL